MAQSSLIQTPTKILLRITEGLSQSDLTLIRFVNTKLNLAAEGRPFCEIRLERHIENSQKLCAIANHPRLSKHVKGLCYSVMRLGIEPQESDAYFDNLDDPPRSDGQSLSQPTRTCFSQGL